MKASATLILHIILISYLRLQCSSDLLQPDLCTDALNALWDCLATLLPAGDTAVPTTPNPRLFSPKHHSTVTVLQKQTNGFSSDGISNLKPVNASLE